MKHGQKVRAAGTEHAPERHASRRVFVAGSSTWSQRPQGMMERFPAGDDRLALFGFGILLVAVIAAYSRTFWVPFLLDDRISITENTSIRQIWPLGMVLSPPSEAGVGGRPLLNLSLAFNYALGGSAVCGYHVFNLIVHGAAAWFLFALALRTLRGLPLSDRFGAQAWPLALAIAAIWALHPMQTESVTYVSQRAEALMGLFYFSTLYCFRRMMDSNNRAGQWSWRVLCYVCCAAGFSTKEVMATAPLMVLLYDRSFLSGGFRKAVRRNGWFYAGLAATWLLLWPRLSALHSRGVVYGVGFGGGVPWWDYAFTESRVIVKYLLLAFWPSPLVFDYGACTPCKVADVLPYTCVLAALLILVAAAFWKRRRLGFLLVWFFLILAPTSSVVPIVGESMAESRVYLSIAGVSAIVVLGGFSVIGRWCYPLIVILCLILGTLTYRRNLDYLTEERIWQDTVLKVPLNPRAHYNLGTVYSKTAAKRPIAIEEYRRALELMANYPEAENNLGVELAKNSLTIDEAVLHLGKAIELQPSYSEAHYNLANVLKGFPGRIQDAVQQYEEALRYRPNYAEAHSNLGNVWARTPGRALDAVSQYEQALQINPNYAEAHNNLGNVLRSMPGRSADAIAHFETALRINPSYADAHNNLANALKDLPGHLDQAIAHYEEALRINPNLVQAHRSLWLILKDLPGYGNEAAVHYQAMTRLGYGVGGHP